MLLIIITIIGVLLLSAGLLSKVAFPAKYVKNSDTCRLTRVEFGKVDPNSCEATDDGKPEKNYNPINPNSGAEYMIDIIGLSDYVIKIGLIVLAPCALIYGYKKFISKK